SAHDFLAELGAFDDEGAFSGSDSFVEEEPLDESGLGPGEYRERRTHVGYGPALTPFALGSRLGGTNALSTGLCPLQGIQLPACPQLLVPELFQLRLKVSFLLLVEICTLGLRELGPIATTSRTLDTLIQRLAELPGTHHDERLQRLLTTLHFLLFRHNAANIG